MPPPRASPAAGLWETGLCCADRARLQWLRQFARGKAKPHGRVLGGDGDVPQGEFRAHPRLRQNPHDRRKGYSLVSPRAVQRTGRRILLAAEAAFDVLDNTAAPTEDGSGFK